MKYCCEYFPMIACSFGWFSYTDDEDREVYLMPYLTDNTDQRIRVNHCPVCGAEVRGIKIPEEEFERINP